MKTLSLQQQTLYNQDFCLWIETIVNQLQKGQLTEIDLDNLIEELEAMGRSEKNSLESNLVVLLMHLLKYKYQPEKRTNSWLYTIKEHRRRLRKAFETSPSLKRYYQEIFEETYEDARDLAATETGLSLNIFPINCPFSSDETLNNDFLPDDNLQV
jgi:hypothetical protein